MTVPDAASFHSSGLHRAGVAFHRAIANRPFLARAYMRTLSTVARAVPPSATKSRLLNNLQSVEWRGVECPPRRVRLGSGTEVRITPHIGEADSEALFERGLTYEREVYDYLETRLPQYDAVVEIGANVGLFTLFFASAMRARDGERRVFAFEPSREAFFRLQQNLRANAIENVSAFNCAVGGESGFTTFFEPRGHLTNGSLDPEFAAIFSDQVVARDVMVVDGALIGGLVAPFERVLVKIDVEGAESIVLTALESFLRAVRPDLMIEVLPTHEAQLNDLAFIGEIFDRFLLTDAGPVRRERFVADPRHRDYVLVPRRGR